MPNHKFSQNICFEKIRSEVQYITMSKENLT